MQLRLTAEDARWLLELLGSIQAQWMAPYLRNPAAPQQRPPPMPLRVKTELDNLRATFMVPLREYLESLPAGV